MLDLFILPWNIPEVNSPTVSVYTKPLKLGQTMALNVKSSLPDTVLLIFRVLYHKGTVSAEEIRKI
jgi:hypothetical protein